MIKAMQDKWSKVKTSLLQEGGEYVLRPSSEPDLDLLEKHGKKRQGKVECIDGKTGACHKNVAKAWSKNRGDIVTGYALSRDGGWRQHSWIEQEGVIKETTGNKRVVYWGAEVQNPKEWSSRQQNQTKWWQPLGWILIAGLLVFTAWWILSGAPLPEVGR